MILIVTDFTIPFLGILAVHEIITGNGNRKDINAFMKYSAFGLTGFLLLILFNLWFLEFRIRC